MNEKNLLIGRKGYKIWLWLADFQQEKKNLFGVSFYLVQQWKGKINISLKMLIYTTFPSQWKQTGTQNIEGVKIFWWIPTGLNSWTPCHNVIYNKFSRRSLLAMSILTECPVIVILENHNWFEFICYKLSTLSPTSLGRAWLCFSLGVSIQYPYVWLI